MITTLVLLGALAIILILALVAHHLMKSKSIMRDEITRLKVVNKDLRCELDKLTESGINERRTLIAEHESERLKLEACTKDLELISDKQLAYYEEMDNLDSHAKEMSPQKFIKLAKLAGQADSGIHDFTGIYILENKTVDKFYVGQSISVFRRASAHFTGKGNMDIYEDYMNGEEWSVKLIALSNSGFKSINALEKHFIEYHHSTYNGYNKTVGNVN